MKRFIQFLTATLLALISSGGFAHEDHTAQLDADLEIIRNTEDPVTRKEMLLRHLHTLAELLQTTPSIDQEATTGSAEADTQISDEGSEETAAGKGPLGLGQSISNADLGTGVQAIDMMQQQQHMVKIMEHMLITQELILGLIDSQ